MASTAQITTTESGAAYLERLTELGVFEGIPNAMALSADCQPIIEALHQVLAGGKVSITIDTQGTAEIFQELQSKLSTTLQDANSLNGDGDLVASP